MMEFHVRYPASLIVCFCLSILFVQPALSEESLRILLTNDDGIDAPGITALHDALTAAGHEVYLIAPAEEQSGSSAAFNHRGVKVTRQGQRAWAVHGEPADAVRFGLGYAMYDNLPDLVISGANFAQNVGRDVNISGTVGAAITALHLGVPAIAISVEIKLEEAATRFPSTVAAFPGAARLLVRLLENLDLDDLTAVLNINYPAVLPLDVRGVRWTELSENSLFSRNYYRKADGTYAPELQAPDPRARARDAESLRDGFVTMSFLDGDMSVPTRRNQRYLDRHLLDRDYTTDYRTTPVRRKPVERTPAAEPDSARTGSTPVTGDEEEEEESVRVQEIVTEDRHLKTPTGKEPAEPPPPAEEPEREAENVPPKKKPDSWLRRIFNPKDWRRG